MDDKPLKVIGVDVGKRSLDVAREGIKAGAPYANDAGGIRRLVRGLDAVTDIVVFERSGGYERLLEAELAAAGVRWAVVHSKQVKAFRIVEGIKAKTDAIDCRLLRDFGRHQLTAGKLRLGHLQDVALAALTARLRQLNNILHAERCRQETAATAPVQASVARMVAALEAEVGSIQAEIEAHIAADPELSLKERVMCQRVGIAQTTARALLGALPQLGYATAKQIAALAGVAPRVHQSGGTHKTRGLAPGRGLIKVIMFYPAQSAMRFDPQIKAFAQRLGARGKPGKVIMVAVMHKMLIAVNAALRDALSHSPARIDAPASV